MKTRYAAILNLVEEENELLPLTKRRPVASLPIACRYRLIDFPFSSLFNFSSLFIKFFSNDNKNNFASIFCG